MRQAARLRYADSVGRFNVFVGHRLAMTWLTWADPMD
jgi:hypothetical protein